MGDGKSRYIGSEDRPAWELRLPRWLRRRPKDTAADDSRREQMLLAVAEAGMPLAPAAYPVAYRCSCERIGCPIPGRHPVSFAWQTQSTTDRAQILRWAGTQPQANFITATGMVHDVLDVPLEAGREALERLLDQGVEIGPVAESTGEGEEGRVLFFTATRGTPEDEDEWWPCELDCRPETMDEHPGLRWHCRGSYVLVPPARLPGDHGVHWVRGPEHPLPDPLTLLETLTDACARYAGEVRAGEYAEYAEDGEYAAHGEYAEYAPGADGGGGSGSGAYAGKAAQGGARPMGRR
ncbi:bifunctional DNA primase/polymerase [Streptomyces clavuligerus]|nr:bifunctional DNA primase/polymerase [Streptomyces clavuligerus]ANW20448.1 DNA primase [Streptomyces clavuligerus]AXU15074.1 DNA primase [Streptomyces clavuligerus]MBY6305133.1 bifunctional DNA primase/polymerase [Streptomyces clavuligerus]QCS07848.1 DNA primase [Streptomyces clavuligerus]QPJ92812.1 DNA primase [Streptomyces clavuligerus]